MDNIKDSCRAAKAAIASQEFRSTSREPNSYIGMQDAITAVKEAGLQQIDPDDSPKRTHEENQSLQP